MNREPAYPWRFGITFFSPGRPWFFEAGDELRPAWLPEIEGGHVAESYEPHARQAAAASARMVRPG
jgi:hypothetical protein